jgi:hypothetical protein
MRARFLTASAVVAAAAVVAVAGPAAADTYAASGNAGSSWSTASKDYVEHHNGDDILYGPNTGSAIDMRWVTCDGTRYGDIVYGIASHPHGGWVRIGTDFIAGTCLHLQYRKHVDASGGAFTGSVLWNQTYPG